MCARLLTFVAEVVDQDDLGHELRGRAVEDAVDGPQQRRPALVVERDDDAGVGQLLGVQLLSAATHTHTHTQANQGMMNGSRQECVTPARQQPRRALWLQERWGWGARWLAGGSILSAAPTPQQLMNCLLLKFNKELARWRKSSRDVPPPAKYINLIINKWSAWFTLKVSAGREQFRPLRCKHWP